MTTKEKILDQALTLFAQRGYSAVFVGDIAAAVGIKAPSLYKHFKSKRDIFDSLVEKLNRDYQRQAAALKLNGSDPGLDIPVFSQLSENALVEMGLGLFRYFLHDSFMSRFRKMLTLEQFSSGELAQVYDGLYVQGPLSYQRAVFAGLSGAGALIRENTDIMALHFYSPIYLMLTLCDRCPDREEYAAETIERHIRQFNRQYKGGQRE